MYGDEYNPSKHYFTQVLNRAPSPPCRRPRHNPKISSRRETAGLVGADDGDRAKGFDSLEGLAEDVVLLHEVGSDGQAGGDGNGPVGDSVC